MFEYDEKWASSAAEDAENNLTTSGDDGDPSNGTTNVNSTAANSPFELLQFSIDPPSDQLNLTGDWMTGGGRNGNSVESGQSEQLQNGLNMDTTNATPTTAAAITTTSSSENASALGNISSSSTERELETETTESTMTMTPSLPSAGPSPTLGTGEENTATEEGIVGRDVNFTRGEAVQDLEDGHKNGKKAEGEDDNFPAEVESIRTSLSFDTQTAPSPPIARANDAIPSDGFMTMGNDNLTPNY
uniref:Uncharacterized protein n=1 Tax=Globodera pallida TaxID=36090 RepID=A0A183CCF8_GLOPA